MLEAAAAEGRPILFTGCGTSEHAARACAAIAAAALPGASVDARDAFEVQLAPPDRRARGRDLARRRTASTLATTAAAGPHAALITARPGGQGAGVEPIVTPRHDESWCHTVAYISPMLTVALGLGALGAEEAAAVIRCELEARGERGGGAEQLRSATRLLAVGSGLDAITASELALKIEEAAYVPTTPMGAEKVLHGHLPAADASTGIVLLRFDPSFAAARDARAETSSRRSTCSGCRWPGSRPRRRSPPCQPRCWRARSRSSCSRSSSPTRTGRTRTSSAASRTPTAPRRRRAPWADLQL